MTVQGRTLKEGDWITIDGAAGVVMLGQVPTVDPVLSGDFATLMAWADKKRRLEVRTNAETPLDARAALGFGAEGIGLCRTEHMFFQEDRILAMREMILSSDVEGRKRALGQDRADAARRLRRAVRDHEGAAGDHPAARPAAARVPAAWRHRGRGRGRGHRRRCQAGQRRVAELREANPMLGLRGCRLGILFPEIYEMQARAIFEAALVVHDKSGETVTPEVMIPLVCSAKELADHQEADRRRGRGGGSRARPASCTTRSAP